MDNPETKRKKEQKYTQLFTEHLDR